MEKSRPATPAIPWIDWTANRIPDPVLRLRFLRAAAPVWRHNPPRRKLSPKITVGLWLLALLTMWAAGCIVFARLGFKTGRPAQGPGDAARNPIADWTAAAPGGMALQKGAAQEVWRVEKTADFETFSNGLRIDNKFSTSNHPRSYLAFASPADSTGERRTVPAGIVYHTTESLQAPFEPAQNGRLKKVAESLLDYVRRKKAYNFVIDRFGRVFRVVQEADAAEHAGYSVWSDEQRLYVNLNESFIGVSLESQTQPGQFTAEVTAAQIRATAMLTEMLRGRYQIPAGNCVTHAQVSVNPSRLLAGYHMDWASSFPFEQIGLPNNYARPIPSLALFGFQYDRNYSRMAGARLLEGAGFGERDLAERAAAAGFGVIAYRKALQKLYREKLAAMRSEAVSHEGDSR